MNVPSTIKTQMNLVRYCLLADWTVKEVLKISEILLQNVSYCRGFFSYFHGQKSTKLDFLCITGSTLSCNIERGNLQIFVQKCILFCQNRLKLIQFNVWTCRIVYVYSTLDICMPFVMTLVRMQLMCCRLEDALL